MTRRRHVLCMLMAMALALPGGAPANADQPRIFSGPFLVRQALTFHVVNSAGAAFAINLRWREEARARQDCPLLVRVFDPDEHLLVRHDELGEKNAQIEQSARIDVPAHGAGVYEVAITGFAPSVDFTTQPPLPFGVFGYPDLACSESQYADAWVCLPPRLEQLTVRCGGAMQSLTLTDEHGAAALSLTGATSGQAKLPASGEHVWRLSAKAANTGGGGGTLNFAGMPIVLCPDEASARAIHSSVDVLDDGTICFHKFQVRAHELLKRYRAMPPSAFAVRQTPMVRFKDAWLSEPARNQLLLGPYGVFSGLAAVLSEQNLDGASPWFGCIYAWHDAGHARTENPWVTLDRLGLSRVASTLPTLAAVYSVHEPFNPLAGDEALRNRVIIAALQEIMLLREHELPLQEYTEYQGAERAFTFARFTFSFPLAVRECPADVKAVWTEALQRYVDHETVSQVNVTCNQWTFLIRSIQQFADGIDDPWYGEIIKRHLRWLLTRNQGGWGWMPAGYFAESGPDATYNGIALHNLAWVYHRTHDAQLKEALRRCMDMFNHTVAPEPGAAGTWMGATSFCPRTPDDWSHPQWGGGVEMLADELPEAAPQGRIWMGQAPPVGAPALRQAEQRATQMMNDLGRQAFRDPGEGVLKDASEIAFLSWQYFAQHPLQSVLPAASAEPFVRVFGDEFMCVRRPAYYAFLYAGAPMEAWQKQGRALDPHTQYPRNGGGLCMFWTPTFGCSLLAKNWSAYDAQTIIAERTDGGDWEDYWSVQRQFDSANARATITSTLLNQPIHLRRDVQFLETAVRCDISLTIDTKPNARALWECFPYPLDKPRPLDVTLLDAQGRPVQNDQPASAICFSTRAGGGAESGGAECHVIVFEHPRRCSIGIEQSVDHYNNPRKHGRVLAEIPGGLAPGQPRVRWLMFPASAGDLPRAIADAIARLAQP